MQSDTHVDLFSLLMAESNFEGICNGMHFHNETEGLLSKEAKDI